MHDISDVRMPCDVLEHLPTLDLLTLTRASSTSFLYRLIGLWVPTGKKASVCMSTYIPEAAGEVGASRLEQDLCQVVCTAAVVGMKINAKQ